MTFSIDAQTWTEILEHRGILFDLDNTIYCYDSAHEIALGKVYKSFQSVCVGLNEENFRIEYRKKRNIVTAKHLGGPATRSRYLAFCKIFEELSLPAPYLIAMQAEEKYWSELIAAISPFDLVVMLLKEAKKSGSKVCIVTDMQSVIQVRKLQKLNLIDYIDHIVTSEEVGVEKPHPEMFRLALKKLSLKPSECIMLGDCKDKDIAGANGIGIKGCLVRDGAFLNISS